MSALVAILLFLSFEGFALESDLEPIIGSDAELIKLDGGNSFCKFEGINYYFRFIVKTYENKFKRPYITHIEIREKSANRTEVYTKIGVNDSIDPGTSGTRFQVYESEGLTDLPKYFYHGTSDRYLRDEHFFANKVNVVNGIPEILEKLQFLGTLETRYSEDYLYCGYEEDDYEE